ncbi:hypothetical protein [Vibrio splendidus]|uniref:hypothetical protein n=1 Tax=Vibrio splendidus TaxID=29497 RepID=UPI0022356186|nr:hypothetical protein [Vibrio splendidus]MCW4438226.1 hypothetical protein [Vibrio splendidus]
MAKLSKKRSDVIIAGIFIVIGGLFLYKSISDFIAIYYQNDPESSTYYLDFVFSYLAFIYGVFLAYMYKKHKPVMMLYSCIAIVCLFLSASSVFMVGDNYQHKNSECAKNVNNEKSTICNGTEKI